MWDFVLFGITYVYLSSNKYSKTINETKKFPLILKTHRNPLKSKTSMFSEIEKSAYQKETSVWSYYTTSTILLTLDKLELKIQSKEWSYNIAGGTWDLILSDTPSLAIAKETKLRVRNRSDCQNHSNHVRRNGHMSLLTSSHHCRIVRAETLVYHCR